LRRGFSQAVALRTTNCVKSSEAALIVGGVGAAFFVGFGEGYEPQFGARPLKRAIQRLIQDPAGDEDSGRRGKARRYGRWRFEERFGDLRAGHGLGGAAVIEVQAAGRRFPSPRLAPA